MQNTDKSKERKIHDLHSHTYYSKCGRDNPRDLIEKMIENKIDIFGITDHSYGIGNRKKDYQMEMKELSLKYRDKIKIFCGIEIPSLPTVYDIEDPSEIKEMDYCLIEHITYPESIINKNLFEYVDKMPVKCGIAHTDLFQYCDMYGFNYKDFFKEMKNHGIFWEMNVNYDSIHCYREHQYVKDFVADRKKQEMIRSCGVEVSVGFDGHRMEDYRGDRVHNMVNFLYDNDIRIVSFIDGEPKF